MAMDPNTSNSTTGRSSTVPFFKLFSFADRFDALLIFGGTIGAIGNGAALPLITLLFGELIDGFGQNASDLDAVLRRVSQVSLYFVYLGLGASVASFAQITMWMVTGERQATRIRGLYLKAILRQDVTFFDMESTTGEVIGRMSGDTILIQDALGEKVGKFIQLLSTFIGGFAIAFVKGWKLTLMMLVTIPAIVVVGAIVTTIITRATSSGQEAYAEAGNVVEQAIGAIRTVAAFTGEKKSIAEYTKRLKDAYKVAAIQGLGSGAGLGALMLIFFCSYALAVFYGSKLIVHDGYTGGTVLNVLFAVLTGGMSLGQASPSVNAFASGRAAAFKMFEVIHRIPEIDIYDMEGKVLENVMGDIEFNKVEFSYPARPEVKIFSNFCIRIPSGVTAALVGESGSGKSTVISLIERFYDPQGGAIYLDGVDIRHLQLKWLRQQIGLVSQEPVLFGTSIKDNIAYGKDNATLEEIQEAALLANASNFISLLPEGYDTLVGEHGTQLSGGQKQRIAIARAILKNPRILLLDEATSALDAESEHLVQDALDRVMMGRTTVIVAHRLTTVRNADIISVLQHGQIVETGKHDELLQNADGVYAQLIKLQQMHHEESHEVEDESKRKSSISLQKHERKSERRSGSYIKRSFSNKSGSNRSLHSASVQHTELELATQSSHKRRGFFNCYRGEVTESDPEIAQVKKIDPDVSIFRLASLNKPEAPILFLGSVAAIGGGVIFPIYGLLLSEVIKVFYEPPHELRKGANFWAIIFVVLGCGSFVALTTQVFCFSIGGNKLVERVRRLTFEKVLQQEISWFDEARNSSGAVSARLSTDAVQVKAAVGDTLSLVVQNIATIVASLVIAFSANWILTLVILALLPILGLQGVTQMKFLKGFSADAKMMYEEASQIATDAVGSVRTVASFCAEEKVLRLYHETCKLPLQKGIRQGCLSGFLFGVSILAMFSSYALCFWFGAKLVKDGKADFGQVFRVFFGITMGALSISQSTTLLPDIANAKAAVNSVFSLLDRKSLIDSLDNSGTIPESVTGNIEFKNVSFNYPTRPDVIILKDFCLTVQAGKTVALVGESGCGKSTVISLLERFYDPETGHIFLDGTDIRQLQVRWLRQQMGLVGQEPVLFNTTIRENIVYGLNITTAVTDEQIIEAALAANAHKFIMELPDGYKTLVGERGIQLSGGQKQRVAIARAIIKNPKILLLDEATSALDAESEHVVQEALEKNMVGRSVIVIAHRLSTIKNADLITVVKEGKVIEQGRHEELLRSRDGAYANLVKLHTGF